MDPRTWVDQLFTYGPYAVLALFVLWVAPAQLKAFRQAPPGNRTQQLVSGFIAVGCWLIVFGMVYYIYLFWPPRTVYLGSLGTHRVGALFFSQTPQLFIASHPLEGSNDRFRWEYAIVTDPHNSEKTFEFAYQWGPNDDDHADFSFPLDVLQKRRINLRPEPGHPENLVYDDDGNPATPPKTLQRITRAPAPRLRIAHAGMIGAAHAETRQAVDKSVIIEWLASSNPNVRAQARAQLRKTSTEELRQMLQTTGLSATARQQIEAELKHRG
jgi:hypothetical protein